MKGLYFRLREWLFLNGIMRWFSSLNRPFVLCYHQIDEKEFDAQLVELKKRFELVELKKFVENVRSGFTGSYCTITLDDCLVEDVRKAMAVCHHHDVPITFFLPVRFAMQHEPLPGTIIQRFLRSHREFRFGKEVISARDKGRLEQKVNAIFDPAKLRITEFREKADAWIRENGASIDDVIKDDHKIIGITDVKELSLQKGVSIQSHTYNHESLALCSDSEIESEFSESKKVLQEITGKEVFAICYPYGSKEVIGERASALAAKYFTCGFTLAQGVCTPATDVMFIPRIGIYPGDTPAVFRGKIYHYMQKALFNERAKN